MGPSTPWTRARPSPPVFRVRQRGTTLALSLGVNTRSSVRRRELALHAARLAASVAILGAAIHDGSVWLAAVASGALFLAAFSFMHDLAHGSLGLPRRANELALSFAGLVMLMSGHALRTTHLRHHARPLAADDVEGAPARMPLWRALLVGPAAALALRVSAFRHARSHGRRWQIVETSVGLVIAAALLGSASWPYVVVAAVAQMTMGVWAAHVPHNAPPWVVRCARSFACTGSVTALRLAYHELHHERPGVPCQVLGLELATARSSARPST